MDREVSIQSLLFKSTNKCLEEERSLDLLNNLNIMKWQQSSLIIRKVSGLFLYALWFDNVIKLLF